MWLFSPHRTVTTSPAIPRSAGRGRLSRTTRNTPPLLTRLSTNAAHRGRTAYSTTARPARRNRLTPSCFAGIVGNPPSTTMRRRGTSTAPISAIPATSSRTITKSLGRALRGGATAFVRAMRSCLAGSMTAISCRGNCASTPTGNTRFSRRGAGRGIPWPGPMSTSRFPATWKPSMPTRQAGRHSRSPARSRWTPPGSASSFITSMSVAINTALGNIRSARGPFLPLRRKPDAPGSFPHSSIQARWSLHRGTIPCS